MIKLVSIADCISLINAVFGFLAVLMIYIGEMRLGFSLILLAILADGLDGIVARKTRQSKIGEYLESMADMTSLGIAPAFFIFTIYYDSCSCSLSDNILLVCVLILFLSFSIIRLASFHIMKDKNFFIGLPASSSSIIIIIISYLNFEPLYVLPAVVIISFLMISNIRFPKLDIKIDVIACVLIFLTIILDKQYNSIAPWILISAIVIYSFFGPLYVLINSKKHIK